MCKRELSYEFRYSAIPLFLFHTSSIQPCAFEHAIALQLWPFSPSLCLICSLPGRMIDIILPSQARSLEQRCDFKLRRVSARYGDTQRDGSDRLVRLDTHYYSYTIQSKFSIQGSFFNIRPKDSRNQTLDGSGCYQWSCSSTLQTGYEHTTRATVGGMQR